MTGTLTTEAAIGTPEPDSEDFEYRDGHVTADAAEHNIVVVRFFVDGNQIASASVDPLGAGTVIGTINQAAKEAQQW